MVLLYRSYTFQTMVDFEHVVLMTFCCYVYVIFLLVGLFFQNTFINTYSNPLRLVGYLEHICGGVFFSL